MPEEPVLEARGLTRAGAVEDVSFTLRRGEVLGLSGLMGSGRTELARMLFGLDPPDRGALLLHGRPHFSSPRESIRRGVAFLTEDRRHEGLLMEASVPDNVALVHLRGFVTPCTGLAPGAGWVDRRRLSSRVNEVTASVRLAGAATGRQAVKTLSGGNQQKVVLAKWLLGPPPSVFILDEPTRGIDVGAKQEVYRIINALAARGTAVLLISSELEELIGMCDRILVMHAGRIRDEIHAAGFDRERIIGAAFARGESLVNASAGPPGSQNGVAR